MHPILFHLGPVTIYSYGALFALAILAAAAVSAREARLRGIRPELVTDLIFWVVLGGLVGARALYVLTNIECYRNAPLEILMLQRGGLVFYGGFFGGSAAGLWYARRKRLPLARCADVLVPGVALAHAIGRLGCFLNGCCYGRPTSVFWGVSFPHGNGPVHPTQLYEAGALLLLFAVLRARARRAAFDGEVAVWYLLLYGLIRFLIEFLRGDSPPVIGGLTLSQVISGCLLTVTAVVYRFLCHRHRS